MVSLLSNQIQRKTIQDEIDIINMKIEMEEERWVEAMYYYHKSQDYCDEIDRYIKSLYRKLHILQNKLSMRTGFSTTAN